MTIAWRSQTTRIALLLVHPGGYGTATVLGAPAGPGNNVSVYLGTVADPANPNPALRIGTPPVDALGAWSVDVRNSSIAATAPANVTAISTRGGVVTAVVTVRN